MSTSSARGRGAVRYLALIYLKPGQREALRRYERRVLPVFKRHGGAFERIWTPAGPPAGAPVDPTAAKPDPEAPAARRDPQMLALAALRGTIVRKAVLVRVADVPLARYFEEPA